MNNYGIGTVGIAARNIDAFSGSIQKGDRVQIVGIDEEQPSRGYDLLDLETGVKLIETGFGSIIPAKNGEIKFRVGTIGVASKDMETFSGKIQKGNRVQIIDIDDVEPSRGYTLMDLDTGVKIIETGFDSIIPVVPEKKNDMENSGPTL